MLQEYKKEKVKVGQFVEFNVADNRQIHSVVQRIETNGPNDGKIYLKDNYVFDYNTGVECFVLRKDNKPIQLLLDYI